MSDWSDGGVPIAFSLVSLAALIAAARLRNRGGQRQWLVVFACVGALTVSVYYAVLALSPQASYVVDTEVTGMYREPIVRSNGHTFWFVGLHGDRHRVERDFWVSMRFGTHVRCQFEVTRTFAGDQIGVCVPEPERTSSLTRSPRSPAP